MSNVMSAAMRIAERDGWLHLRRQAVARAANVSTGSVSNAFGTFEALRDEVMKEAVRRAIIPIVRDGIAARNPIALAAPVGLRKAAGAGV